MVYIGIVCRNLQEWLLKFHTFRDMFNGKKTTSLQETWEDRTLVVRISSLKAGHGQRKGAMGSLWKLGYIYPNL